MCEANVYFIDDTGTETLFLECVDKLIPEDGKLTMVNIFGQQRSINARIKELNLVDHRIILQK